MNGHKDKQLERKIEQRKAHIRKRILKIALLISAIVSALLGILSLPDIQLALFPGWLIEIWAQVVAALVVVMIASVIVLPVLIEANLNPRVLSGPGESPDPGTGGGHPPLGG